VVPLRDYDPSVSQPKSDGLNLEEYEPMGDKIKDLLDTSPENILNTIRSGKDETLSNVDKSPELQETIASYPTMETVSNDLISRNPDLSTKDIAKDFNQFDELFKKYYGEDFDFESFLEKGSGNWDFQMNELLSKINSRPTNNRYGNVTDKLLMAKLRQYRDLLKNEGVQ
tara:strand:+ start:4731 stop:5240 length:510 start_codon:yes stop_codon:yes gene_type:complete